MMYDYQGEIEVAWIAEESMGRGKGIHRDQDKGARRRLSPAFKEA